MPFSERLNLTLLLLILCFLLSVPSLFAQVPGSIAIINTSGQTAVCINGQSSILDPNGDCSVANTPSGFFSANGNSEINEFEALASGTALRVPWTEFQGLDLENSGDTYIGGPCNGSDLISDGSRKGSFAYYTVFENSGIEYIAFRFRSAQYSQNNYGFNLLISNDGLLGGLGAKADNNYLSGNAGFEREVRFITTGNGQEGVYVYDVDGRNNIPDNEPVLNGLSFPNNWQASYAAYNVNNCSANYDAGFYTIYLPLSAIGINNSSLLNQIQVVLTSSDNGSSFFSSNLSDIGGLTGFGLTNPCNCSTVPNSCSQSYTDCMLTCLATTLGINSNFPVEWHSMTAKVEKENVSITWVVNREENNDYFTVERRIGDGMYIEIARIDGRGTAETAKSYTYLDAFLIHAQLYYRVRQTDIDGNFSFSPVVQVNPESGVTKGQLSQIPGSPELQLRWFTPEAFGGYISVLDLSGRELDRQPVSFFAGQNTRRLQYPNLPEGVFVLQLLDPMGYPLFAQKFIR